MLRVSRACLDLFCAPPNSCPDRTGAYTVDGKLASAIDPNSDDALWAAKTGEDAASALVGAPQPAGDDRWVLTDLAGRVVVVPEG